MVKPLEVNDETFDRVVLKSAVPVFVDFWRPGCQPCLAMAPFIDELAGSYDGKICFVKVNVAECPRITGKYGVMGLPSLMIFREGHPFSLLTGLKNKKELRESLEEAL